MISPLRNFHQNELAFCGYSNSGKSTLLQKCFQKLSSRFKIGYAKSDAHGLTFDTPGKDSDIIRKAGAHSVYINDSEQFAQYGDAQAKSIRADYFEYCDFVLIEGHKRSPFKKILVIDSKQEILELIKNGEIENICATVSANDHKVFDKIPHFQRDQIEAICEFILQETIYKTQAPLYGLLLSGGKSSRMQKDKATLCYGDQPQLQKAFSLLKEFCAHAWVSCRDDQNYDLPRINDTFIGKGPMGGILSAMEAHPEAAWLVMAIDLPLLNSNTLEQLINGRKAWKVATTFLNPDNQLPEPLCSIYEPVSKIQLFKYMAYNIKCPRKVLINTNCEYLQLENKEALMNGNTPEDFKELTSKIQL